MHYFGVELVSALCTARKNIKLINAQTELHKELIKCFRFSHSQQKLFVLIVIFVLLKGNPFRDGQKSYMPKETTPFYFDFYWLLEGKLNIQYFALTSNCNYLIEN